MILNSKIYILINVVVWVVKNSRCNCMHFLKLFWYSFYLNNKILYLEKYLFLFDFSTSSLNGALTN